MRLAHVSTFGRILELKEVEIETGLVQDDLIIDPERLKIVLKNAMKQMGLHGLRLRTNCLIPESRVFSYSCKLDASLKNEDVMLAAKMRAQKEIPLNFEHAHMALSQGLKKDGEIQTTVFATEDAVIKGILQSIDSKDFCLVSLESDTKSHFRFFQRFNAPILHKLPPDKFIGILDVDHAWVTIAFFQKDGETFFSRTVSCKQYEKENVPDAMLSVKIVDMLIGAVEEAVLCYQSKDLSLGVFILTGAEAANASNILEAMKKQLPQAAVFASGTILARSEMEQKKHQVFSAAIGAALRAAPPHSFSHQYNFLTETL